ncbi:hypothetical protein WMF28_27225 [Sorangium sp. So ce590]|uniref:hypothetical protein n=1 Tax=Sorangium sp. So ce590 TaxID=3133317 RepID=UPI003F62403A
MPISRIHLAATALVAAIGGLVANAGGAFAEGTDFSGTYVASLPDRAEIMHLHRDGTAGMTLSDQVTFGAGGFTFSDSLGSWRRAGDHTVSLRTLNLNFDLTGAAPAFSGIAVVDYVLVFAPDKDMFTASCQGKIFATGVDPLDPGATPITEFDCAYLDGYTYHRSPAP